MKALSKPLSSPSRADKFPPPLVRFLRSNVGSKSRGRSRSSPMFYMRGKRNANGVIETTQEPSSPKVTCIGQVRVRRSAKSKARKTGAAASAVDRHRCCWLKKTVFCGRFSSIFRIQNRFFRRVFCKWGLFFRSGYCKKVDATEDSFRVYSKQRSEKNENIVGGINVSSNRSSNFSECEDYSSSNNKYEIFGGRAQERRRDFLDSPSSPPKNALLLTRCRSAPYRSSSLGARFWNSPLSEKTGDIETANEAKSEEFEKPINENLVEEPRTGQESSKELENPVNAAQELKGIAEGTVHPLLLTRCKSEPARTGERLNPEANYWKQRRFGAIESYSLHNS